MADWTPPNSEYPPPKAGEPELFRAARVGDHEAIARLAAKGADLNAEFDIGLDPGAYPYPATPLMVAAGSGDGASVDTLELLIRLGADPNKLIGQRSAASFAAQGLGWNYRPGGDARRLQVLLEAGVPLAGDQETSNRMLCEAAAAGDLERVRLLAGAGLDVNGYFDSDASRTRAERLLGSMPSFGLGSGLPGRLKQALADLNREMIESSASGPMSFEVPLHRAAESGNADCVRYLIDQGASPLARDNQKRTALYAANSKEAMEALLEAGCPMEDQDEYGWTPLADAVRSGVDGMRRIQWLVELGADVNATHDRGYTILMGAVSSMERDVKICRFLVESGADLFAVSELGYNAFHAAIDVDGAANEEDSVRGILGYLKEIGVDINARNRAGETPLTRAKRYGTKIEQKVLRELGAK